MLAEHAWARTKYVLKEGRHVRKRSAAQEVRHKCKNLLAVHTVERGRVKSENLKGQKRTERQSDSAAPVGRLEAAPPKLTKDATEFNGHLCGRLDRTPSAL